LAELRRTGEVIAIGLGFAVQEQAAVPSEPWDQTLDMILTECGLIAVERA
jgi:5-formyltetrahydrofolate cyclo-ligase